MSKDFRRVICVTGNGKGKTTSLLGSYIRALGQDLNVCFYQFLKSNKNSGEYKILSKLGFDLILLGYENRKNFSYDNYDINACISGFNRIKKEISTNRFDLVIIDEISYPINFNWIKSDGVVELIEINNKTSFILSGRNMPKEFIEIADTVSEINELKHGFNQGFKAQKGIEF